MGVLRKGLVLAVIAVALGFAPTTANATTIEQAIRIEATVSGENLTTLIETQRSGLERLLGEPYARLQAYVEPLEATVARGAPIDESERRIEQAMRTAEAAVTEDLTALMKNGGDLVRLPPWVPAPYRHVVFGIRGGARELHKDPKLEAEGEVAGTRLSFAAKLEFRGNDQLGVRLYLQALAAVDPSDPGT